MKIFKVGIIGYGGFGKFLHNSWKQLDNVEICAIADSDTEKTKGLDPLIAFTDWQDLLREEIDLIAIATIPNTHAAIAIACMKAGKHVLIEKPFATDLADAAKIMEVRDATQTVAGIDFMFRFNPLLIAVQHFCQQNTFGQLRRVSVENYAQDDTLPPTHWFWKNDLSGGILIEHGVHFIDLVNFLSPAKVVEINGLRHNRNPQQEDQVLANVRYDNGLIASHYHSFARPGFFETTKIKLTFDLADIELFGWIPLRAEVKALVNRQTKQSLRSHPLFDLTKSIPIREVTDESRPKGWGLPDNKLPSTDRTIRAGGLTYEVSKMITGKLLSHRSKQVMYANCLRASLLDVLKKIKDPMHSLAAPLEAGMTSLEIAVRATESARSGENMPQPS